LFCLNQDFINFQKADKVNKFIFAPSEIREFEQKEIKYKLYDNDVKIPIKNLIIYNDLPAGIVDTENIIQSPSRIDSLIPALSNIHLNQKSKNINLKFAGKFLVSNERISNQTNVPMEEGDKRDIENNLFKKDIIATNHSIKSYSLSNDFSKLLLDETFAGDAMKVAAAYGVSRDVLNYYVAGASTYENQIQSVIKWIQGDIQFEADVFSTGLASYFNYNNMGKEVVMRYDHLPVMQEVEKTRIEKMKVKVEVYKSLIEVGFTPEEAKQLVQLNLDK
jgi:hypothetical protein